MNPASLSEENAALKALLAQTQAALAEHQAALAQSEEARRRLEAIVSDLQRDKFGSKSEKLSAEQFNLPLEDIEIAQGMDDDKRRRDTFGRLPPMIAVMAVSIHPSFCSNMLLGAAAALRKRS